MSRTKKQKKQSFLKMYQESVSSPRSRHGTEIVFAARKVLRQTFLEHISIAEFIQVLKFQGSREMEGHRFEELLYAFLLNAFVDRFIRVSPLNPVVIDITSVKGSEWYLFSVNGSSVYFDAALLKEVFRVRVRECAVHLREPAEMQTH